MIKKLLLLLSVSLLTVSVNAQKIQDGKLWLNEDGSNYFKVTLISQVWVRNTSMNPGTTINGYAKDNYTDIGIRRARLQAYGQIADRVFIYSQIGMNNFNFISERKAGFFIHDITGEYEVARTKLSLGGGLTAWNGLSRYAAPAVGSIMGLDAPLFEQTTNDVTDQFLRKLSIYAKGKFGKLDYRLTISSPMAVQRSTGYSAALTNYSTYSAEPAKMQWQGYFQWQFLDQETNTTPYATGTYLGTKRVFNIGAGFQYQPKAMWHLGTSITDTIRTDMRHFAVDAYYDAPINTSTGEAISVYATYMNLQHGPGYIRNQATMNPANGTTSTSILNGGGNGYPSFGTGTLLYGQVGYKFKNNLVGSTTFMPYASMQWADYDRLANKMKYWELGTSWLLKGHTSKLTFAYQNRPVFDTFSPGSKAYQVVRKTGIVLQYQVFLN